MRVLINIVNSVLLHLARNVLVDGRLNIQIGTDQEEVDTNLFQQFTRLPMRKTPVARQKSTLVALNIAVLN